MQPHPCAPPSRPRIAPLLASFVALAALGLTTPAPADTVSGTRSSLLDERAHEIVVTMHPGHAELSVRRTVFNGGERHDQAMIYIDLPDRAVATGLATLGRLGGRPHWFKGELMEAEAAADKYRELTGIGGYYPKDPALLSWRSQGLLALQVFPCPPGEPKSVEYTLTVPTEYRDGAHHLLFEAPGTASLTASIRARPAQPRYRLRVNDSPPPPVLHPDRDASLDIALSEPGMPLLGGDLVTSQIAPQRALVRYAVRAAPRLSEVPRGAYLVLAIDASLSTDPDFQERARAALGAYLSYFEDARVEVILFNREIERAFQGFLPIAKARTRLESLTVVRKNGSDVERALFEADRLLAATPRGAPRRIVLVTDGLTRENLTAELLRAATATAHAVTHVGLLVQGAALLSRNDDHAWAWALRQNRGLLWWAAARAGGDDPEVRSVYEEWARPVRLDHVHLTTPDPALQEKLPREVPALGEGEGLGEMLLGDAAPSWLTVEGELWTEPTSIKLRPDPAQEKLLAAEVFGSEVLYQLTEPEMMTLAMKGGAVSPVTSYLAIEPGVRPSTEGLEQGEAFGSAGLGVRSGATSVSPGRPDLDRQAFLERTLSDDWRRCGGRPGMARVRLETTLAEVVSVDPVITSEPDLLRDRCLGEAVWHLILPAAFDEAWTSWTVDV